MNIRFFSTRENEGRHLWLNLNERDILSGKKTIHFTTGAFDTYDFDMTATTREDNDVLSYGEIKTVHRDYVKFPNFQIDYKKLKALQDLSKQDGRIPYLVCFFEDYTIVWDITDINLEERKYNQFCTSTMAEYTKGKREKEEVWLTIDEAIYKEKRFNN